MTTDPSDSVPLKITRPMMVAILIVMGIAVLSALNRDPIDRVSKRPGYVFGHWSAPTIRRQSTFPIRVDFLPARINEVEGTSFFVVDHPEDGQGPTHLAFIHHADCVAGDLRPFAPSRDSWPPPLDRFGLTVEVIERRELDQIENAIELSGPSEDSLLRFESIDYEDVSVQWACLRRPPAWPLRIHIGRVAVGENTLILTVFEFDAAKDQPDYRQGHLARIARAIGPE